MTQTRPMRAKELSEQTARADTLSLHAAGRMGCKLRLPPAGEPAQERHDATAFKQLRTKQLRGSTWETKALGRNPTDIPALEGPGICL